MRKLLILDSYEANTIAAALAEALIKNDLLAPGKRLQAESIIQTELLKVAAQKGNRIFEGRSAGHVQVTS